MITIRKLEEVSDFLPLIPLQEVIWDMPAAECVSPYTMRAVVINGGSVFGAYDGDRVVGLCFGFPSKRGDQITFWSFMAGVHPDYQGQSIGYELKQTQRLWAQEYGYHTMSWTYDPMQRGNANFNFNRLGIVVRNYFADFYGAMSDGLNAGLASDRFEASWEFDRPPQPRTHSSETVPFLLHAHDGKIVIDETALDTTSCAVEIPADLKSLKQNQLDLAIKWQLTFREMVQRALAKGFIVVEFVDQPSRGWFVLRK